jgi:nitroreductase
MTETYDVILKRRSIRHFTDQPVEKEIILRLLEAAMAAPSAMNAQPWEFVVITEPEVLEKFHHSSLFAKMKAPVVICVLGSRRMQKNKAGERFWVQDCSAASENILLAATAFGLGSVWVGVYPVTLFEYQISRILNLPEGVRPLNLLFIGYPAEEKDPRTQYQEQRVHWGPFPEDARARRRVKLSQVIFQKDETDEEH